MSEQTGPSVLTVMLLGTTIEALPAGTTMIVDTSGTALARVARHSAAIIEPSQRELVGWEPATSEQIERRSARSSIFAGSRQWWPRADRLIPAVRWRPRR